MAKLLDLVRTSPNMAREDTVDATLVGTPQKPARDPKPRAEMKGSIGDMAVTDAVILVLLAWLLVFVIWYSLRHHNV